MNQSVSIFSLLLLLTACAAQRPIVPAAQTPLPSSSTSRVDPQEAHAAAQQTALSDLPAPVQDSQAVEAAQRLLAAAQPAPLVASLAPGAAKEAGAGQAAGHSSAGPGPMAQTASSPAVVAPSSTQATISPLEPRGLSAPELALWKDPDFLARFTNSYLPDTSIEPTPSDEELLTLAEVGELMGDNKLQKALALLEKSRKKESSALLDCYVANLYLQEERLQEACAAYRDSVEKFPKFKRAWSNLALASIRQADYRSGLQAGVRALELGGASGDLYGLLGLCHMQLENNVAAESAYRMANLLQPGRLDWELGMANAFVRQQRFQEAAALFGALIARQPDQAHLWAQQAKAYLALNQPGKAAENFKVIDALGAADADTLALLANIYINDGLTELGADNYLRAFQLKPEAMAPKVLSAAKSTLFLHDNAADAERLLAALDPNSLPEELQRERLNLLARISIENDPQNIEDAALLEQMLALDPLDGDALIRLARSYGSRGAIEKALFHFERAGGLEAFEERAKLAHGQYLAQLDRGAEAIPLLRRALELRREANASGTGKQQPVEQIEKFLSYVERKVQGRTGQ
jgi:tetratricopeptide (TPR) repeat protein